MRLMGCFVRVWVGCPILSMHSRGDPERSREVCESERCALKGSARTFSGQNRPLMSSKNHCMVPGLYKVIQHTHSLRGTTALRPATFVREKTSSRTSCRPCQLSNTCRAHVDLTGRT